MKAENLKLKVPLNIYSIQVSAFASLVVEAPTAEEAMEAALDAINLGDLQHDETYVETVLTNPDFIESAKRHADKVVNWEPAQ